MTSENRFHEKYEIVTESGCWIWTSAMTNGKGRNDGGYPVMWLNGKNIHAHRFSYQLYKGEIPENMCVCHKCDIPSCVNPDHLFLGTHEDNAKDRSQKGRNRNQNGTKNNMSKLREADVINIRAIYKYCDITHQELADIYKVGRRAIGRVIDGSRWNHL